MNASHKTKPRPGVGKALSVNKGIRYPLVIHPVGLHAPKPPGAEPFELRDPVRIIKATWSSITGMVPFGYLGAGIRHESLLEGELLRIIKQAGDPKIGVLEQPCTLDLRALGFKKGTYTPDFLCWVMVDPHSPMEVTLVEVKPAGKLQGKSLKKLRNKIKAAMRFARRQGWRFRIISERHLRRPPRWVGEWPRIHQEAYSLAEPREVLARLFGDGNL